MQDFGLDFRLALLGFGNAGQAFAALLEEKRDEIRATYGRNVIITAIVTGSRGSIVNPEGIDTAEARRMLKEDGAFSPDFPGYCDKTAFDVISSPCCDAVLELTPLNIMSGQPAINHILEAFAAGKHVVSANKGPVAWAHKKLKDIADKKGLRFYYETTVMDGTPIFNLAEKTLNLCRITEISGILNSTTNYILDEMADGVPYDTIIENGRKRGFIEADSAMDIEGYDAAAKLTALLNVLADADITPDDVDRTGIENITAEDVKNAESRGMVIRLVCRGKVSPDGEVTAEVAPEEVPAGSMLACVRGTTSLVSLTTDLMGTISIVEHDPEIEQTAYGIFSDVLRLLQEV